jgi:Dolichyl-phosphate-mannose-protein mannosyltransferase
VSYGDRVVSKPGPDQVLKRPGRTWWAVAAMLMAGTAVRLVHLFRPPFDFHPIRQFDSALIARYLWVAIFGGTADAGRRVVELVGRNLIIEPPIHELLAAAGFWVAGSENFWIPRLISIAAWVAGGWCLYLLGKRLASPLVGAVATGFYLFAPFAITASRTFMPDPLMVAALVVSALVSLRYVDSPTRGRLVVAAAGGALAVLLKAQAVFIVLPVFAALLFSQERSRRSVARYLTFAVVCVAPAGLWLAMTSAGGSTVYFLPSMLSTVAFWDGWLAQMTVVVGVGTVAAAIVGAVRFPSPPGRAVFWGWIAGYVLLAFFFDYRVATHSYYSLPLVPVVGLGLGMLAGAPMGHLRTIAAAVATVSCLALLVGAWRSQVEPLAGLDRLSPQAAAYRDVGRHLAPGSHGIAVIDGYGSEYPLDYYAGVSAQSWPSPADRNLDAVSGHPDPADDRLLASVRARSDPGWLVVMEPGGSTMAPSLVPALERLGVQTVRAGGYSLYCFRPCRP